MSSPDNLTGRADILLSEAINGEVRVNLGDAATGEGWGAGVAMWGIPGFVSMPEPPSDTGAAEALYLVDGPRKYVVAARDNRIAAQAGAFVAGDRAIYSSCAARFFIKRANNEVVLYSTNDTDNGTAMAVDVNGSTGTITITCSGSTIQMTKDSIVLAAGDGSPAGSATIEIKGGVVSICGTHFAANVGGGNLGTVGPIPPPQGLMSMLAGPMGQVGVASTRWTVALTLALLWHFASLAWAVVRSS